MLTSFLYLIHILYALNTHKSSEIYKKGGDRVSENLPRLTKMQSDFIDAYIANGGNGTQAALSAGYSENTARSQASQLLSQINITKHLKKRTEEMWSARAMTIQEALALSASIARGEPQQSYFKETDKLTGEVTRENERLVTPSIEDRQRSLDHIFKVSGAYLDKKEITATVDTNPLDKMISQLKGDQ